jgi:hypothetical protein
VLAALEHSTTSGPAPNSLARSTARRTTSRRTRHRAQRGDLATDADPAALAPATMTSIEGGPLLNPTRRDPQQLRIALDAA